MTCKCNEPHLGLATTRELLDELTVRLEFSPGGLDYRTVGGEEIVARGKGVKASFVMTSSEPPARDDADGRRFIPMSFPPSADQ